MSDKQGSPSDDAVAPLRAIVVDDNPVFLRSASRLLASIQGVEVVGAVTSGKAALAEVALARPDLVLLDLAMPEMDGLEVTRLLSAQPGAPKIIIMTVHDLPKYREVARASGAYDFVTKSDLADRLRAVVGRLAFLKSIGSSEAGDSHPEATI